jgi:DNA polymerase-4
MEKIIFHIDVNNAFLSWTAVDMLNKGYKIDIRTIPSIIGGDEESRHGIVLAKSPVAKKFGIKTAMPIFQAKQMCPWLKVFESDFRLYSHYSKLLYELFLTYTPLVERFSIDECFLDLTNSIPKGKTYLELANEISQKIKSLWGYTVNIGIAHNKLLAKMASDLEKPDKIHTILTQKEIEDKMWPLPVNELLFVGKQTASKLNLIGIKTIGELAKYDETKLIKIFGKYGKSMHESANGISTSEVNPIREKPKSISQETTLPKDISSIEEINEIVVDLSNEVSYRLRKEKMKANVISVDLKTNTFQSFSHQKKLLQPTNSTKVIINEAKKLVEEMYDKKLPIRLVGVKVDKLIDMNGDIQISLLNESIDTKQEKIDSALDQINSKYKKGLIKRGYKKGSK